MLQCPNCQTTYADETLSFCLNDGTALVRMPGEQATVVRRSSDPIRVDIPTVAAAPQYVPARQVAPGTTWASSSGGPLKILLAAAVVLVLLLAVIGGVGALLYFNSGPRQAAANIAKPTPTPATNAATSPSPIPTASINIVVSTPPLGTPPKPPDETADPTVVVDKEAQMAEAFAVEKEIVRAAIKGDIASLSENTTDDFTSVDVNGKVHSKKSVLAESRSATDSRNAVYQFGKPELVSADQNTVVIRYTLKVGMPQSEYDSVRMTETYVKQDGRWLLKLQKQGSR